jgi:hypothetical protein
MPKRVRNAMKSALIYTGNLGCEHQLGHMCKSCYYSSFVSPNKATCHPDRPLHAKGLCEACYRGQQNRERRLQLRGKSHHTEAEWRSLLAAYPVCARCHRLWIDAGEPTRDHMLSVVQGGDDSIENMQPLCLSCNSQKQRSSICYLPPIAWGTRWARPE